MKKPDEIKKGLEHCCACKPCLDQCPYGDKRDTKYSCETELLADALACIQQLEDHVRDLTKMIPKWISVEERLPKGGQIVLCETMYFFDVLQWDSRNNVWIGAHTLHHKDFVIHWMPLPESPKEV